MNNLEGVNALPFLWYTQCMSNKQITILCACGAGLGSSMIIQMNIEKALNELQRNDADVNHIAYKDMKPDMADLFVVGKDLANLIQDYPRVIVLNNLLSYEEIEDKLKTAFSSQEERFWIED